MIGRGIIRNPALVGELEGEGAPELQNVLGFHDMIYDEYQRISSGERNVLFKMKEFWTYIGTNFEGSEKLMKKIKKAERLKDYEAYVKAIFETCEWKRG
jgi:tRNA-dihydrouridine synthase